MRIGELDQHCGECKIIDLCGEPYSDICLCRNPYLSKITEDEYIGNVDAILNFSKRNWSNKTLERKVVKQIKKEDNHERNIKED